MTIVYQLLDGTDEEGVFCIGLFSTLNAAIAVATASDPDRLICGHHGGYICFCVHARTLDVLSEDDPGSEAPVVTVMWKQRYNETNDEYTWDYEVKRHDH